MSFNLVVTEIKNTLVSSLDRLFGRDGNFKYGKQLALAVGLLAVSSAAFFGHRWYVGYRERAAQKQFAYYLAEVARAHKADTSYAWQQAGSLFKVGYDQNKSSYLAPYFLVYQAHSLFKEGKHEQAIDVLDSAIGQMSASPLINLYKTKRALMLLDIADAQSQGRGVQELEELGNDASNIYADVALFYLGRYYWVQDNVDEAKVVWQKLVDSQQVEKIAPSPWASEAAVYLDSIV